MSYVLCPKDKVLGLTIKLLWFTVYGYVIMFQVLGFQIYNIGFRVCKFWYNI
jgi:hypothetical protein